MDWDDLRHFLHVARTGSLTQTAARLRVSPSTVSRRIAGLEADLRTSLFARHQTGYALTDQGRDLLRRAEAVEEGILALERDASGLDTSAAGVVRLATAETLATHLVIPALPALARHHPGIRLDIITGTDTIGLSRHEADLALRLVRPESGNLTLRKVGTMAYAVYGSGDYLRRHPGPAGQPLAGRAFVTWDEAHAHLPAARWLTRAMPGASSTLATSSLPAQLAAAHAGVGLEVLPCFLAGADSGLVRVMLPVDVFAEDLWLVAHADLGASARVRVVSDFLANTVADARAALSGDVPACDRA